MSAKVCQRFLYSLYTLVEPSPHSHVCLYIPTCLQMPFPSHSASSWRRGSQIEPCLQSLSQTHSLASSKGLVVVHWPFGQSWSALQGEPDLHSTGQKILIVFTVKYRGPILCYTWPALGSNYLNLDQSGTSIQVLLEPNTGHVTCLFIKLRLYFVLCDSFHK